MSSSNEHVHYRRTEDGRYAVFINAVQYSMPPIDEVAVAFCVYADGSANLISHGPVSTVLDYVVRAKGMYSSQAPDVAASIFFMTSMDCGVETLNRLLHDGSYMTVLLAELLGEGAEVLVN